MTLFEFLLLNEKEQTTLLYKEGVYIGKRKEEEVIILLYQLNTFYVEIFYKKYRCFITRIHPFNSLERITPYLEQINIDDLVKCLN